MFVTSDIFDLRRIGMFRNFGWREHLLCGVDLHGPVWPGPEPVAEFLMAAAKRCGLFEAMQYASYMRVPENRSSPIAPKSLEKLARGELRGAKGAIGLFLQGFREAPGSQNDRIGFGGEASAWCVWDRKHYAGEPPVAGQPRPFRVNFVFPLEEDSPGVAAELLRAGSALGAEYGYVFVRDDLCSPLAYGCGLGAALDYSPLASSESNEVGRWWEYAFRRMWLGERLLLRDLFQQNLLSAWHLAEPIKGLGPLSDWINAQPGRGRLEDLGQGRRLWSLSDKEMVDVRPALNAAGLLHSCRERIYRDMPGGFSPSERGWPPITLFRRVSVGPRQ